MRFIIGGKLLELRDLGNPLDREFISLHAAYFGHGTLNLADFEAATFEFFNSNPDFGPHHDNYFNNFTFIWNNFLSLGNFEEAENIWNVALEPILKWEAANSGKRIHKGTAYYFWGMTALQRGDLDKGYILMHKAVEEDVETLGQEKAMTTPGFAFVSLNYAKADQAFRAWVLDQARFLNALQNKYSALYKREFILETFRARFLSAPPNVEIVSLFAYALARLMRVTRLPDHILRIRFAGQIEINILFDITLVIDEAIRAKNTGKWKFIDHAEFLLIKIGSPLSKDALREINDNFDTDMDSTLRNILNGTFVFKSGSKLNGIQEDVAIAYGLRNHGAHNVSSVPAIPDHFLEIEQKLLNVLFATVDYLY